MLRILTILLIAFSASTIHAQALTLGDREPDWANLKGTDDKLHSLADFKDKEVLVIAFTCNSCPYAQEYEDRLIKFCEAHCGQDKKVAFVAINANKVKEDQLDAMKKRAADKKLNYRYLWDETQEVARAHDAKWTPEFYVFDKDRKLVYRGAFDDSPDAAKAKISYVANAVTAILAGEEPKTKQTDAIGCAVRYERKRRK